MCAYPAVPGVAGQAIGIDVLIRYRCYASVRPFVTDGDSRLRATQIEQILAAKYCVNTRRGLLLLFDTCVKAASAEKARAAWFWCAISLFSIGRSGACLVKLG